MDIVEFEAGYGVTRDGRIFSRRLKGKGMVAIGNEWKELGCNVDAWGYRRVSVNGKHEKVHRIVARTFIGEIQHGLTINHINGIKTDNRVENLEIVSMHENIRHATETGLKAKGERIGKSKLTVESVVEIISLIRSGISCKKIGSMYGVTGGCVSAIKHGRTWSWVE